MMSGQNPHPGDMHHGQIPVGCPNPSTPLTLIGALCITWYAAAALVLVMRN